MFKKKHFDGWGGRSAEPKLDREGWEKVREMVGYLERLRGMVDVEIVQFLRAFREAGGRGMGSFTPRVLGEKVVNLEGLAKVVVWVSVSPSLPR